MILAKVKVVMFDELNGSSIGIKDNLYDNKLCLIDIENKCAIDICSLEEYHILSKIKGKIINDEKIDFENKFVIEYHYLEVKDYKLLELLKMVFLLQKTKKNINNKQFKIKIKKNFQLKENI